MTDTPNAKNGQGEKLKVFLCHASEDGATVGKLASRLREMGWLKVWRDKDDLLPGQNWELEIPKEVKNSQLIIICLSNNIAAKIIKGSYINKEFKLALEVAEKQPPGAISIIPLRLEECTVPEQFEKLQWANYFDEEDWQKLIRALETRASEIGLTIPSAENPPDPVKPARTVIDDRLSLPKLRAQFRGAEIQQVWGDVITLGEAILALVPTDSDTQEKMATAYYCLAQADQKTGHYGGAMVKISMAIEFDSANADYFWERAVIYRDNGKQKDALKDFLKAIELEPEQAQFYFEAAKIYHQSKQVAKALEYYQNALLYDSDKGEYFYYRGLIYKVQKKEVEAEADFEEAVSLGYAEATTELAQIQAAKVKASAATPPRLKPPTSPPVPQPEKVKPAPPPETEQEQLLKELLLLSTTHRRRWDIGERLAKIGDTRPGVGLREDGLPDIAWCPVTPGGEIILEKSQTFKVAPFFIAQYPVTFAQYEAFVRAGDGYDNPKWWQGFPKEYQRQKLAEQYFEGANKPRDRVSWYQAVAFCRWLNQRLQGWTFTFPNNSGANPLVIGQNAGLQLPTEWEWQWAAQGGTERREYPWGQWQEGYANTVEAKLVQTTAVGMYPHGAAKCEAQDMSGQVWEWCENKYFNPRDTIINDSKQSLRGGSYYGIAKYAACVYRGFDAPGGGFDLFWGFRVGVSFPY
jgi:formylglycine-generating enzyme required for sulfatase activity/Tfp pilus assembly protein PilF